MVADMDLTAPTAVEFGCLPRDRGRFSRAFGDGDIPTYIDKGIDLLPRSQWRDDVGIADKKVEYIYGQLDGMCTSNGTVQAMMICRALAGLPYEVLSAEDLYDHVGRWGTGSALGDNIDAAMRIGVRTQEQCPKEWPVGRPSGWELQAAQNKILEAFDYGGIFDAVVTGLHYRIPSLIGVTWPGGGGHAIACTRFVNGKLRGPNSWGNWGDNGFYELTERQCASMRSYGALGVRVVSEADKYQDPPQLA